MFTYIKNRLNTNQLSMSFSLRIGQRLRNLWPNLTIYQKMIMGYMLIVFMVVVVSIYTITILFRLNAISTTILSHDIAFIDMNKRMINSILSQDRTRENYLLLGDRLFLDSFQEKKKELIRDITSLEGLAATHKEREEIEFFKKIYFEYTNININTGTSRKQIDDMVKTLEGLIAYRGGVINKKMENSREIGGSAARLAVIISMIAFISAIALAFFITRSISEPIKRLQAETTIIAKGNFSRRIDISSRDEIGELAEAFNIMCYKLNELERLKSEFIANVSHEFRTPLTSLKEANNLMLDGIAGRTTEKQQRLLGIIREESDKLIKMIHDLLDLSKLEAGMVRYNFMPSDINIVIEKCVDEMRLLAEGKHIDMNMDIGERLPIILMDSEKIKQVITNLLSNAVKFTPDGGRIIVKGFEEDANIRVEITDTGIGISKEDMGRIFDKFQQADTIINKKIRGTGLGLSIARHIMEAHKGSIWAESELGKGSNFIFLLPIK